MNVPKLRFKEFTDEYESITFDKLADYKKGPFGSSLKKDMFVSKNENSIKVYEQQNAIKKDWTLERYFITKEYYEKLKGFTVKPGDIIVSCAGTIGEYYVLPYNAEIGVINQALMRINTSNLINQNYFLYIFDNMVYNFSKTFSNGSAIKNIPPFSDLKKQIAYIPSMDEQNKVANFLSLLDKKIELQTKKIENLKLFKKGLNQKIFSKTGEIRSISQYIEEYNNKTVINNQYPILSSTFNGIVVQNEYFNKQAASSDNIGYKIIPRNYITYRSMSDTGEFHFNIQDKVDIGIVSPAYPVFKINSINVNYFLNYINESCDFKMQIMSIKEGGTRFALSFNKFKNLKIKIIDNNEAHGELIGCVNKYILLENEKLVDLNKFKEGLIQNMFV